VSIESYFSFRMVRRTITPVDQVKDILPHAVYPVVEHLRAGTGIDDTPIEIVGASVEPSGEAFALLRLGAVTAVLQVSLNGRPVEHFVQLVGTNGSLRADFIGGYLDKLTGPGEGVGVLVTPYRRALHALTGATRGIARLVTGGSYPGLRTLVDRFYASVQDGTPPPLSPRSIVDTVSICEQLGARLDAVEATFEADARTRLLEKERTMHATRPDAPRILLTGGTGLLGKRIAQELRTAGHPVRSVSRRLPPYSRRVPGVDYAEGDLARGLDAALLKDVGYVVHAAAETSGGMDEHRRNSVEATRKLIEEAARAGVRGVVHVSSLAVLKSSREIGGEVDESTPVDVGNLKRGPYVWGKAQSEIVAQRTAAEQDVPLRIVRPGPLVDYAAFQPPGRLGREVGPWFVAIGPRGAPLSVCDVTTAACVVRSYIADFDRAPAVLNMVEAPPPTRRDLVDRYKRDKPDQGVLWIPAWMLRLASGPLKLVQRLVMGSREPVDVAAAFSSERYRTDLAARVIAEATRAVADK
jgi:nucleoside-diphosphate-sugar epimerase